MSELTNNPAPSATEAAIPPAIDSRVLFAHGTELVILHNGRHYRLRITQNGKLILTA